MLLCMGNVADRLAARSPSPRSPSPTKLTGPIITSVQGRQSPVDSSLKVPTRLCPLVWAVYGRVHVLHMSRFLYIPCLRALLAWYASVVFTHTY